MRPRASTPSCTIRGWRRMWRKTKAPRKKPAAARILRRILMAAKPVSADKAPPQAPAVNGWIIIDKPLGLTSTQVVGRVRRVLKPRKIGHGGTLDPLASGLLPIALGEATKTVSYVMDGRKSYRFTLRWRSEEHTSELQSLMSISYAVFCLKKKHHNNTST